MVSYRRDSLHCHEEWCGSVPPSVVVFSWGLDEGGAAEMCSIRQCLPPSLEVECGAVLPHLYHVPQWTSTSQHIVHFLWTRRTGMLPFTWLAFQVWFVWANRNFVYSDDSSKEVIAFPLVAYRSNKDCIAVPLLHLWNFKALQVCGNPEYHAECGAQFCDIPWVPLLTHVQSIGDQHPTGKQGVAPCCSPRGVVLYGGCPERHPCLPGTL